MTPVPPHDLMSHLAQPIHRATRRGPAPASSHLKMEKRAKEKEKHTAERCDTTWPPLPLCSPALCVYGGFGPGAQTQFLCFA